MNTENFVLKEPVFINYRKEDTKYVAAHIHDDLEYVYGSGTVFIDLSSIRPGKSWPKTIRERLSGSKVVIVIIGRDWLKVQVPGKSYRRRIDADGDWVRTEIEEAFTQKKKIFTVFVRDAEQNILPEDLPNSISKLSDIQSIVITAENWKTDLGKLINELNKCGLKQIRELTDRPERREPSMIGVIDYFYRQIGQVATTDHKKGTMILEPIKCNSMRELWMLIETLILQRQSFESATYVYMQGQLSPYAPLLFGNPVRKRQLHLELRQCAVQLIEELGYEFGELLNGLLSYSAGQMVIRAYFRSRYVYLGLYESIVRNSIPVFVESNYFKTYLANLFVDNNTINVGVKAVIDKIPNYAQDALTDFGITDRLRSVLSKETLQNIGKPNYALFIHGDDQTYVKIPKRKGGLSPSAKYLDGDVWIANAKNSLITRFIDISWRRDMTDAVGDILRELRSSTLGRGVVSSFDIDLIKIDDKLPGKVLSGEQLIK
jgi:hypothetical protein